MSLQFQLTQPLIFSRLVPKYAHAACACMRKSHATYRRKFQSMNSHAIKLFALALTILAFSCQKKSKDTDQNVSQPEPAVATQIEEPVRPQVVETQDPEDLDSVNLSHIQLEDVYFDFDQATLRDDARSVLNRHAEVLKANPRVNLLVEGHCDERGTQDYNLALGERRAERVRAYLVSLGIGSNRMRTISYGESQPKAQGSTEESWALNRRAHFVPSLQN